MILSFQILSRCPMRGDFVWIKAIKTQSPDSCTALSSPKLQKIANSKSSCPHFILNCFDYSEMFFKLLALATLNVSHIPFLQIIHFLLVITWHSRKVNQFMWKFHLLHTDLVVKMQGLYFYALFIQGCYLSHIEMIGLSLCPDLYGSWSGAGVP